MISIHPLLAERDRRGRYPEDVRPVISIHPLLAERDKDRGHRLFIQLHISIHPLLAERDVTVVRTGKNLFPFQSTRSSRSGTACGKITKEERAISIHPLLAERDPEISACV